MDKQEFAKGIRILELTYGQKFDTEKRDFWFRQLQDLPADRYFNNIKELTAYCGLDPSIKQSGKSVNVNGPISKSGNKYIRKMLYIACSNIIRVTAISKQENDIEIYYRKKRNEGKHHYASIVACTTKLLRKILALCKQLEN